MCRMINAVKVCAICAAVSAATVFADTIELRNGAPILNARIAERSPTDVKFYIAGNSVLYVLEKSQILRIVYDNGAIETPAAPTVQPPPPPPPPAPTAQPPAATQPAYTQPTYTQQPMTPTPQVETQPQTGAVISSTHNNEKEPVQKDGVTFGVRAELSNYDFISEGTEGSSGYGASLGGSVSIPITNTVAFKPEIYFTYRLPMIMLHGEDSVTTKEHIVTRYEASTYVEEFAICIPLLVQAAFTDSKKVFVEAGIEADIPFLTSSIVAEYSDKNYGKNNVFDIYGLRTKLDIGIVAGLGFKISDRTALDLRSVKYLNSFHRIENVKSSRYSLGLSVLF